MPSGLDDPFKTAVLRERVPGAWGSVPRAPGEVPAAWSLPVTFFCLRHGRLLASRCPHCGRPPASRSLPSRAGHCGGPHGCGGQLGTAGPPRHDGIPAVRQAQETISGLLAGVRDPAGTAAGRHHALNRLTDITLTAYHLAADSLPQRRPGQAFTSGLLDAGVLTTEFTLLPPVLTSAGKIGCPAWSPAFRRAPFPRPSRRRGGRPARC